MQNSLGCASADQMCHCGSVFIDEDEDEPHSSYRARYLRRRSCLTLRCKAGCTGCREVSGGWRQY